MKTFKQLIFTFLLVIYCSLGSNVFAQIQAEIEGTTRITASAPRLELFDSTSGENRTEGWLEEGGDRIYLTSFYDDLVFSASTTGVEVERMWLDATTGGLGIGTDDPSGTLELHNETANGAGLYLTATAGNAKAVFNSASSWYSMGIKHGGPVDREFFIANASGPSTSNIIFELDNDGKLALTPNNSNESMTIFNDGSYTHAIGVQEFGDIEGPFIMASEENYLETGGIYGSGDGFAIWSTGDGAPNSLNAYLYILDEDLFDANDTNPYNNGALKAYVTTAGVWQASDNNKKENITAVNDALGKVNALNAYRYDYKRNQIEIDKNSKIETAVGVMAQELIQVVPEAVQVTPEGEHFVNYSMITPVLIEAIKEQQVIIEQLESRLSILENN